MGKTAEGYGSCKKGCTCPRHRDAAGRQEVPQRFLLTVRRRSGKPVNRITGEPEDTIMVHGREDLERRIRAAENDPDYEVSYRDAAPPPQASSLRSAERPEPDWSWLDGDDTPPGDFWAGDADGGEDEPTVIPWGAKRELRRNATREDKEAFRRAHEALQENSYREKKAGIRHETPEYLRLNDEVWRLGRKIGKW